MPNPFETANDRTEKDAAESAQAAHFLFSAAMNAWLGPSLWVAVRFKLPDLVAQGTTEIGALVTATQTDAESLARLMNALSAVGLFKRSDATHYQPTAMSRMLETDHPTALSALIDVSLGGENHEAWSCLEETVRSGQCSFDLRHGVNWVEYYRRNPERQRVFAAAMTATTRAAEQAVLEAHDFGSFELAVDIGGSSGSLVRRLLNQYSQARGVVFDLPSVIDAESGDWANTPEADRVTAVGGDFFKSVPDGDLYLLKLILHDWQDTEATAILKTIRRFIRPNGHVAIIETVLPDSGEPHTGWGLDIAMMAVTGGKERTLSAHKQLLDDSGFKFTRQTQTQSAYSVIEAEPV